jgi:3-oxosteroid 1-dehydrogenase
MSISAFEAHSMLSRELKSRFTILGIMLKYFLDYPGATRPGAIVA